MEYSRRNYSSSFHEAGGLYASNQQRLPAQKGQKSLATGIVTKNRGRQKMKLQ
jgi:hypothetical protein